MAVEVDRTCNEADSEVSEVCSEVGCSPTERVRTMLDEQGVEYHECKVNECVSFDFDYCPQCDDYLKKIIVSGEYIEVAQKYLSPEQAIAATVGGKPKDNPQNYKPNGEPKLPNMTIGADPDWVDWVASLEHKKPSNLTEAVRQLMFETICFGGDMGPNDCGGEYCPDEGMVHTNNFIESWVHTIAELAGYGIQFAAWCDTPPEMMVGETLYDDEGNAVGWVTNGATMGVGTCKLVDNDFGPDMHCSACGGGVDDEYRYFMDSWGYSRCPHCGARIIAEATE